MRSSRLRFLYVPAILVVTAVICAEADNIIDPTNVAWKPFAIRNNWQHTNHLAGGDGKQMQMALEWNLQDTRVLYLVTDTTRAWKSVDRGWTWFQIAKGLRVRGGCSIASDPLNVNVVYMAGCRNQTGVTTYDGLYRSTDGGSNWTLIAGGPGSFTNQFGGQLILIDRTSYDPGLGRCKSVYAGLSDGMLISTNGGTAWRTDSLFNGHHIVDIEVSMADPAIMYVASHLGFFRYNTALGTVTTNGTGLPGPPAVDNSSQWDLAVSPAPSNGQDVIYAATTNGVWKSTDGGTSFVQKSMGLLTNEGGRGYCRIAISPRNPDRLLTSPASETGALRSGPFWSHDGGETWNAEEPNADDPWHQEILEIPLRWHTKPVVFDPDNADVAMTFIQTPVKSYDGGTSWHYSANGQIGARVNDISFSATNQMMLAMTDYGVAWSSDGGQRFELKAVAQCMSADLQGERTIAGGNMSTGGLTNLYMCTFTEAMKTYGSGALAGWTLVTSLAKEIHLVRFHKTNTNIVYAGTPHAPGRVSSDGGASWTQTLGALGAIDNSNADRVYMGVQESAQHLRLYKSDDRGDSAISLGYFLIGVTPPPVMWDMDVDPFSPTNARNLVAALGSHGIGRYNGTTGGFTVLQATNAALALTTNEEVRFVRYDPVHSNVVWAGVQGIGCHGKGIYLSQDGGLSWTNVNNNLGAYEDIFNIAVSPLDGTVYVTGAGLYSFSIEDVLQGRPQQPRPLVDTDGDGIPDDWESEYFGGSTNATPNADTDGDGLNNLGEYSIHASPTNSDSDADGLSDGWEVQYFGDMSQGPDLDPDNDGWDNHSEYMAQTDPTSIYSTPLAAPVVSRTNVNVRENGEGRFFTKLDFEPITNTTVTVSWAAGDADIMVISNATMVFTPANWSSWQRVTLCAANDLDASNTTATLQLTAPGFAPAYITATELDDDIGTNLARASTVTSAAGWTFASRAIDGIHTLSTNYAYAALTNVMILNLQGPAILSRLRLLNWDWSRCDQRYRIDSSLDGSNWSNLVDASTNYYTGWDDWPLDGRTSQYLRITAITNSAYSVFAIAEWELHAARLPMPVLGQTNVNVRENGGGRFFVRLNCAPTGNTTLTVAHLSGDTNITVTEGSSRAFTPTNWSTWQRVTLQASDDADTNNGTAQFQIVIQGLPPTNVTATELDDDIGTNLALASNGGVMSGSSTNLYHPYRLIDGIHTSGDNFAATSWNATPTQTMTLTLTGPAVLSRLRLLNWDWWSNCVQRYRIDSSLDGSVWSNLVDASVGAHRGWEDWSLDGRTSRYIRITGLSNSIATSFRVAEWEVYAAEGGGGGGGGEGKKKMADRSAKTGSMRQGIASVVTSDDGSEHTNGWPAVDGDTNTYWVGRADAEGWYIAVEYDTTRLLTNLAIDLVEGSLSNILYLYSLNAETWLDLSSALKAPPVDLKYLWLVFPTNGTSATPGVIEIRLEP